MTTAVVIQARMTSTRLPGKVLRPILARPMLSYQIERLRRAQGIDHLIVATTTNATDDPLVEFCRSEGLASTRGSESDVLSRYREAAASVGASTVVRVTSDCPLLDPAVVDRVLGEYRAGGCDFASNMLEPSFPLGMAVEVMSFEALASADREARDPAEREHVTPFIYWRPERFRLRSVMMRPDLTAHRWTVDTIEDFTLIEHILGALYPRKRDFDMADVLELLRAHPQWADINRQVPQKRPVQSQGSPR